MFSDSYQQKSKSINTIKCRVAGREKQLLDSFNFRVNDIIKAGGSEWQK